MKRPRMVKPVKKEKGHATMTYATTTPLVTNVFNQMFKVYCSTVILHANYPTQEKYMYATFQHLCTQIW